MREDEVRRGKTRVLGQSVLMQLRKGQEVDKGDVGRLERLRLWKGKKEKTGEFQTRPGSLTVRVIWVDNSFGAT
jgi:hypothetical protein